VRLTRPFRITAAAVASGALGVSAASALIGGPGAPVAQDPTPVPGSERIGPTVPDPVGGLAWALRVYTSTSGGDCVEVGRMSGGRFGQLDAGGAFQPAAPDAGGTCGALASEPSILALNTYPERAGRAARTVLFGLASPAVGGVLVQPRDGSTVLRLAIAATGGFLLPLAGAIAAGELPVTVTLADGRRLVHDWNGVRHNNAADDS
jgi:hypothetical protein